MPVHLTVNAIVTASVLGWLTLALAKAQPPIALTVRPMLAMAPRDLYISIRLQPHASDRVLRVSTDGDLFARSSSWTIEGESSPKHYSFWWKDVPAGRYAVWAVVGNGSTWRATAVQDVILTGEP